MVPSHIQQLISNLHFYLVSAFSVFCLCPVSAQSDTAPNIILIMADDLGYAGIGCYGNQTISTPHLDKLAASGLLFTDFHSNGAVCTPTRAALLTGRYQQRAGLEGVIYAKGPTRSTGLDPSEITIAQLLKSSGYATGIFGKWHLGYEKKFNPTYYGFDEFYGYVSGNIDFHTHYDGAGIYDWWHNKDTIRERGYVTDLITKYSVEFIQDHRDRPFFLYIPHEAPHVPFQGRDDPGYRYPNIQFSYHGPVKDTVRAYREMIEVMDEGIGQIVATLKDLNLEENTIIIFISDNGAESFGHNGHLNGAKGSLLEGGHRVPAIVSWKGKISPGISDATTMSFDWLPTILSLSGTSIPADRQLDGINLRDHLINRSPVMERDLFWRYRKQSAVRRNSYKLLINDGDTLLFNLKNDPSERHNLSGVQPAITTALM
ncbi:MAG: sulfatase-like hydrolase/transferase, partial [Saprospiraceae bacterium]|nr:sulfatase-like hydrolase/transferase [Saprospiraceae bacterium]